MLTHPTLDLLRELGLTGMASGFKTLDANPEARTLGHAEWLGLLLEHEATARRQKVITHAFNGEDQAPTVLRMVPKGLRPVRRAVSTTVRMSASPSAAHIAR